MALPNRKRLSQENNIEIEENKEVVIYEPELEEDDTITTITEEIIIDEEDIQDITDSDIHELTDEDFEIVSSELNTNDFEYNQDNTNDISIVIDKEENKKTNNSSIPKEKKSFNLDIKRYIYNFKNRIPNISFKKIGIILSIIILILILFIVGKSFFSNQKNNNDNKDILNIVSYKYLKDDSNGAIFEVSSKENKKIIIQRIFKDNKSNKIILCESLEEEILKDKTTNIFVECLNNSDDNILETNKNIIQDNLLEVIE